MHTESMAIGSYGIWISLIFRLLLIEELDCLTNIFNIRFLKRPFEVSLRPRKEWVEMGKVFPFFNHTLVPLLNRKRVRPVFEDIPSAIRNVRDTVMAVSIETNTPRPKTSAKPLMSEVPK